jgi:hypothetical protein
LHILRPHPIITDTSQGALDLTGDLSGSVDLLAGDIRYQVIGERFIHGLMNGESLGMIGSNPVTPRPHPLAKMDNSFRTIHLI